jgi:hypothetical protein
MTKAAYTVNANQLPVTGVMDLLMRWNCDEYCIAYNRKTRVLTVEEFEGFDDENDGAEMTRVCGEEEALSVLDQHKPGWPGLDGFVLLKDYYGPFWTIGTEAI